MNTVIDHPIENEDRPTKMWLQPGELPMRWAMPHELQGPGETAQSRIATAPGITEPPKTRANTAPFVAAPPPAAPHPALHEQGRPEPAMPATEVSTRPPFAVACMLLVTFGMLLASLGLAVSAFVPRF